MGNLFTINMEENFKKNQEFIQDMNRIKMERQIQLQFQLQERQMAMKIANNRDICLWLTAFYITSVTGLFTGFRRTKRPYLLMPVIPLTFLTLYYWDAAYGNKVHRIRTVPNAAGMYMCMYARDIASILLNYDKYLMVKTALVCAGVGDILCLTQFRRNLMEAEHIMTHEADSLEWPCGLPTPSSVDLGRLDVEEKKKIHPPLL